MTLRELECNIDFHDSILEKIYNEGTKIILEIDLCNWRQKNYRENEDETKLIKLILSNPNIKIGGYKEVQIIDKSILIVKYKKSYSELEFILHNDERGSISIMEFAAENVEVI